MIIALWLMFVALAQEPLPLVAGPAVLQHVEAPYPEDAKAQGLEGTVVLLVTLDETGAVTEVALSTTSGHPGFDDAALAAVRTMTFSPARTAEGPVAVSFEFAYGFTLEEEVEAAPAAAVVPTVSGQVRTKATRRPVAGAQVVVIGSPLTATTDETGHFTLTDLPTGEVRLRVAHQDHESGDATFEAVPGEVAEANIWLEPKGWRENQVVAVYEGQETEVTRRTLSIEEIRTIPGTFGDPIKVIQTLPGAARSPFGTGALIIRGSNPEDSGVYVDGVRIPLIYHLTGTTSVLNPEIIAAVDYLPGGYGVQYGRSMGGVVDVRTKTEFDPDEKISWGTDILDSQVLFEGQVGKKGKEHGFAIGARRSYIDLFIPLFTGDTGYTIKPRYWDYQVKWVPPTTDDRDVDIFLYGFDDTLTLGTPDDVAQGDDQDTQGDFRTQYDSHRLVGHWRTPLADGFELDLRPAIGIDTSYLGLGQDFVIDNGNVLFELRAEAPWKATPAVTVVPGVDFLGAIWWFDFQSSFRITDLDDPLAEREAVGFDGEGGFWSPDPYLRLDFRPLDDRDRWLISPGLRGNVVTLTTSGTITGADPVPANTTTSFDPRLLTRFQANERLAFKASTGLYHQPPQPQEIVGVGTQSTVGHEQSWSTSVGAEQRISDAVHYDIDLFYKRMTDLIVYDEAWTGFGTNPFVNAGEGRAYGAEVILRHDPTGPFFGWVSYTLSRASRLDWPTCTSAAGEPLAAPAEGLDRLLGQGDCWYPFDFDQTHILSAQGGLKLPHAFQVSAQVQYVTGNPTDLYEVGIYDVDGDFYNGLSVDAAPTRNPPFFQTSVRIDRDWHFKALKMRTYVDLMNVVRAVNSEFTLYNYDYSEVAYVRGLPFIPNIGVELALWP